MNKSIADTFASAQAHEKNKDYKSAIGLYLSVITQDKRNRAAYVNLGSLYSKMNMFSDAVKCYQRALSLGSDYMTHFNIGCIYYRMGQYKKAVINLEKSRSLRTDFYLSPLVIGLSYSKLKNTRAAESNFIDVLKIVPGQKVASTALALLYYNDKRYDAAISIIDQMTGNESVSVALREIKSRILYQTGKIDESATEIKSLKKISNGYTYYDQFISSIPVDTFSDKYGTLDDKISILASSEKSDSQKLLSLSLCYLFKGDTDKAIDYLFQAKKQMQL